MAELGVAASIFGICTFGIQLTSTLYEFGCTTSAACEQTDRIANRISLYATTLEVLADRLEDEEPIISAAAVDLVEDLYDQSDQLFRKIQKLLPKKRTGRDDLPLAQHIAWYFKKSKVDLLLGELDSLKGTVHLLVTILFTGKTLRRYRRQKRKAGGKTDHAAREPVHASCLKARNAIIEQIDANEKLPDLQREAERSDVKSLEHPSSASEQTLAVMKSTSFLTVTSHGSGPLARIHRSLTSIDGAAQRRAHILDRSSLIIEELLALWTTLDDDVVQEARAAAEDKLRNESPTSAKKHEERKSHEVSDHRPERDQQVPQYPRSATVEDQGDSDDSSRSRDRVVRRHDKPETSELRRKSSQYNLPKRSLGSLSLHQELDSKRQSRGSFSWRDEVDPKIYEGSEKDADMSLNDVYQRTDDHSEHHDSDVSAMLDSDDEREQVAYGRGYLLAGKLVGFPRANKPCHAYKCPPYLLDADSDDEIKVGSSTDGVRRHGKRKWHCWAIDRFLQEPWNPMVAAKTRTVESWTTGDVETLAQDEPHLWAKVTEYCKNLVKSTIASGEPTRKSFVEYLSSLSLDDSEKRVESL